MNTNIKETVHVVIKEGTPYVFKQFEDAVAFVSEHNYKAGMCKLFEQEDDRMVDVYMEDLRNNMWQDTTDYQAERDSRLEELGITESDLMSKKEILFIQTTEVI